MKKSCKQFRMTASGIIIFIPVMVFALITGSYSCGKSCPWKNKTDAKGGVRSNVTLAQAETKTELKEKKQEEDGVQTVTLPVKGMTCTGCEFNINKALKKVKGVKSAQANSSEDNVIVTFDITKVKVEDLIKAVNKTGYEASIPEKEKEQIDGNKQEKSKEDI